MHSAVTLKIDNRSGQEIWVMWTGTNGLTGTSNGIDRIAPSSFGNNAAGYPLSSFKQVAPNVYQIHNFTMGGGRMWFTYGNSCWTVQSTGYSPSLANFNDPNFTLRYDKIEAYITGSTDDNLDITAVDGFSIPFSVKAFASASPSTTTQTLRGSAGNSVIAALGAIAANASAPAPTKPAGATTPMQQITGNSPYLVINANSQGKTTAAPYTLLALRQQRRLRARHRQRQSDRHVRGRPRSAAANYGVPENYSWGTYNNYVKRMDGRAATPTRAPPASSEASRACCPPGPSPTAAPRRLRRRTS